MQKLGLSNRSSRRFAGVWRTAGRALPNGIRGRLFMLIVWSLLPLLILQGMIYYQNYTTRRNQALQTEMEVAQAVATAFATYVDGIRKQLDTIGSSVLTVAPYAQTEIDDLLKARSDRDPTIQDAHWVSPKGIILASSLPGAAGYDFSSRRSFEEVVRSGRSWAIGNLVPPEAVWSSPRVGVAVAIRDKGGVLRGVVVASIAPANLEELAFSLQRRAGGTYDIFDREGKVAYHYPSTPLSWEARFQWKNIDRLLPRALNGQVAVGEIPSINGDDGSLAARVPIADMGWVAGASRPTQIALTPVWRGLIQDLTLALLATSIAFLLALMLARTIAGPLSRLEHDARLMGAGRVNISPDPQAPDEVRKLHGTVADMAANLLSRADAYRELTGTLETKVARRTAELEHRARQLEKLTLELSQAEDRERKRLAEILHDDLQQQLAAAKFQLGLLGRHFSDRSYLRRSIVQLDQMLKDAIETSRDLSHELNPAVMSQAGLVETIEWLANYMRTKHGLSIRIDAQEEINPKSEGVKSFLGKAAKEMLFNVAKHAKTGEATVRVRRKGRLLYLSLSDHGRGFDPQKLRESSGFGLLSIRERVQLLGGRMRISSIKGEGSQFIIAVPDDGPDSGSPASSAADPGVARVEPAALGESRLRVLVADDHAIVREGLVALLNEARDIAVVAEAGNGREAVERTCELEPDVVIMDVSMPLISGEEATRQIKNHLPDTRIIAFSMYQDTGTIARMHRAGAEAYVLKTVRSDDLLAAVRGSWAPGIL